jgi:hypothetical protein
MYEKELLTLIIAVTKLKPYLIRNEFIIKIDQISSLRQKTPFAAHHLQRFSVKNRCKWVYSGC